MTRIRVIAAASCLVLLLASGIAQDSGLGKGKGKGGGSGGNSAGGGQATPPPKPPQNNTTGDRKPTNPPPQTPPRRTEDSRPPRNSGGGDGSIGKPGGQTNSGTQPGRPNPGTQSGNNPPVFGDPGVIYPRGDQGRTGGQGIEGRKGQSRSGNVQYGTVNNDNSARQRPMVIDRAPVDVRNGSLEYQVRRQERVSITVGYRSGYVHYDQRWRDDYFYYPYYSFTPVVDRCVVSPWYYYAHLPGYVVINRIEPIRLGSWRWYGTPYNWRQPVWNDSAWGRNDLDYALEDLQTAFERRDSRALGRLLPRRGRVNIAIDGHFAYSLDADDFYDMLSDAMWSTRTSRYLIEDVRTWGNSAHVLARHEYTDPWGRRTTVYHSLKLESEREGMVIRDFGTSNYRGW